MNLPARRMPGTAIPKLLTVGLVTLGLLMGGACSLLDDDSNGDRNAIRGQELE